MAEGNKKREIDGGGGFLSSEQEFKGQRVSFEPATTVNIFMAYCCTVVEISDFISMPVLRACKNINKPLSPKLTFGSRQTQDRLRGAGPTPGWGCGHSLTLQKVLVRSQRADSSNSCLRTCGASSRSKECIIGDFLQRQDGNVSFAS